MILLGRRSSMLVGAGYVGTGGVVPVWVGTGVAGTVVLGTVLGVVLVVWSVLRLIRLSHALRRVLVACISLPTFATPLVGCIGSTSCVL